ncbi:hypothetical protein EJ02DRAFT_487654 [Clathrospora elynae]|uniref:J domain-containing protein n=1 Tax=Clathrospora elynae TaxID=706981 RepID=A0A6A5SWJ8_9PLEO|nr:hypothetical protein EJ02DRAFT_487654 [Clathrospora elynae]
MYDRPAEPETPDYYINLGVSPDATEATMKECFSKLALEHHPDKKAPGDVIESAESRKALEGFEILRDADKKADYDEKHPHVRQEWENYHRAVANWERRSAAEAEAEAEYARSRRALHEQERLRKILAMGKIEKKRQAAMKREVETHDKLTPGYWSSTGYRCPGCIDRSSRQQSERRSGYKKPTPQDYTEYLQMKADGAEQRSREARHEQQERDARERMKKE